MDTPLAQTSPIIIAGAGIAGSAAAYFLARQGLNVEVLDAAMPAAGASGASDGAVSVASKRPGPLMSAALEGIALYRSLAQEGLLAAEFHERSTFIVASTAEEEAVLERHGAALASAGIRVTAFSGPAIVRRFPALSPAACLVLEVHGEGHAIGYQVVHRLLSASRATVHRNCKVEGLLTCADGSRIIGVHTSKGTLDAGALLIATGNGTSALLGLSGVLTPRKGQLLVTERDRALSAGMPGSIMSGRYLLSKGSQKAAGARDQRGFGLVIDPLRTGQFLIGGTREDNGDTRQTDLEAVSTMLRQAADLVPGLARLRLLRSFAGARTAVADALPLAGRLPGCTNGYILTGFEGDGICLGPVVAKAMAALICGQEPELDLAPFAPDRFASLRFAA